MKYLSGFDTETTGVDVKTARIVTASVVAHDGERVTDSRSWLIDPGVEIPPEASDIHGITTEVARAKGADAKESIDSLAAILAQEAGRGIPVVAFNLAFDWSILHYECLRYGLPTVEERIGGTPLLIDPYVIDKELDKYRRGTRKLQPTAELYGVELTNWHDAEADALAAVLLTRKLFARFPHLETLTPKTLTARQAKWRRDQAASLQAYFRNPAKSGDKYNPDAVVDGGWPLITGE